VGQILPPVTAALSNLRDLYLLDMQLKEFTLAVATELQRLTYLNLAINHFSSLQASIGHITTLQVGVQKI